MDSKTILICDDDPTVRSSLSLVLKRAGYGIATAETPEQAVAQIRATIPGLILMDMNYTRSTTGEEGLELLAKVKVLAPEVPVILITAWGSIHLAVQGIRAGAFDFITKPWNNLALLESIRTAIQVQESSTAADAAPKSPFRRDKIIGKSPLLERVLQTVSRIASTHAPVLITGESGTGKELIAEAIHENSERKDRPFIKVNLGGISLSLFESEMFGHKKGAFTDAKKSKAGRMEVATNGTLFLDEIGNLSLPMQSKLLTAIEKRQISRLGSTQTIPIDVRLICATNADIRQMVEDGNFRQDLLYRINTIEIHIPPLRERGNDIILLAEHFLNHYARKYKKEMHGLTREAKNKLLKYAWPGNVRELQHTIERAVILGDGSMLKPENFLFHTTSKQKKEEEVILNLEQLERQAIEKALRISNGNISRAAEYLGITRFALYRKLEKLGL